MMTRYGLGIDVGGTFTDLLLTDMATDAFQVAKAPTTPGDQAHGVLNAIDLLGVDIQDIATITHGTTAGTNAILERKGARVGMITTRGFRDVIELGRRTRPYPYGMIGSYEAITPRELRFEVSERISAEGEVLEPLDEQEVVRAIEDLLALDVEALVIHFLHSYINPIHEEQALAIALDIWPSRYVTAGSRILPEFREFERGITATLNAYIQPTVTDYIEKLNTELGKRGLNRDLLVMQGNGGMMAADIVHDHAIHTVMSGPAAGATAAAAIASHAGYPDIITCDMGGTSFDVSLIRNSVPLLTTERELGYGLPVRVPMIDIETIGAGGGSVARVNAAGIIQVGPESAGSSPGPICYGLSGRQPTVTDANLLLGRVDPSSLPGDFDSPSFDVVSEAIVRLIGQPLGLNAIEAASAIIEITNNQLAGAIRIVSIEKGHDPRDFVMFAFGGAGPSHAVALARELGIPTILIPRFPGITSALGCIVADVRHDYVQSIGQPLASVDPIEVEKIFQDQINTGSNLMSSEGVEIEGIEITHEADLLYRGQSHIFRLPVDGPAFDRQAVLQRFSAAYLQRFDIELSEMKPILSAVRTTVLGRRPQLDLTSFGNKGRPQSMRIPSTRQVYFDGSWLETQVYQRSDLSYRQTICGPAIIEQSDTTIIVDPGAQATVDTNGNLVVRVNLELG